jgi:serine/threonine-protein kinase HipA
MKIVHVFYHANPKSPLKVGEIAYVDGQSYFQYSADFLETNLQLSPFSLKPIVELQEAPVQPFNGLHGVFADSLPDGWGMLLMDRKLAQQGINLSTVTPIDRLTYIGGRGMGALSYHPDEGNQLFSTASKSLNLDEMASESIKLFSGEVNTVLDDLASNAISPGGARPKALIGISGDQAISGAADIPDHYEHWIVKFPTGKSGEEKTEGIVEYLYSQMARQAGIDFPDTRLIKGQQDNYYFAAKRFDRDSHNKRIHMHTLAGLIHANYRVADCDYITLLKVCFKLTESQEHVLELLKRMIFNVMVGNRDDHTKNFSFLMNPKGQWKNSPAYDLTYNRGISGWHSMAIGSANQTVNFENIYQVAKQFNVSEKQTKAIVEDVVGGIEVWFAEAPHYSIPAYVVDEISAHLNKAKSELK